MKNLYELIDELPIEKWHYYYGLNNNFESAKPFIDNLDYSTFILNYFKRGGKVEIFESCQIDIADLRLPNHICSVFFLGVLVYYKTSFHEKYKLGNNEPEYSSFPFIWFLIALFHDNAYQMEDPNKLTNISTIKEVLIEFDIQHSLLKRKFSACKALLQAREKYFLFRKKKYKVVDHGILGGLLLFDRLVKIRRKKKRFHEDNLFWGPKLENQYKTAANAISIHNIWLQDRETCEEYHLDELLNFTTVKFEDFPLFYILGIVDTIEPLKTFRNSNLGDKYILEHLYFDFTGNSIKITNHPNSKLDFDELLKKVDGLKNWLDLNIIVAKNSFELEFK